MKLFQRRFGRILSGALAFVLLLGPVIGTPRATYAVPGSTSLVPTGPVSSQESGDRAPDVVQELVEKRSENGRQLLLSDGTIRAEYFANPIHYRDAQSK